MLLYFYLCYQSERAEVKVTVSCLSIKIVSEDVCYSWLGESFGSRLFWRLVPSDQIR